MKKKSAALRWLARDIVKSMSGVKANDIRVLDLRKLTSFTDYFVICSGSSSRHIQSISDRVMEDQKHNGHHLSGVEGYESARWVLLDYGSVVVHIFHPDLRGFYNIEKFWGDAKRVRFKGIT